MKVPFTFKAGNRTLPAGTYRIEMLTQGQPGVDRTEVIALRGMETGSYTTMVARLGKSEAKSPVMSFAQSGETPMLAELCANGRSFALTSAETDYAPHRSDPRADLASGGTLAPAPAALGQE